MTVDYNKIVDDIIDVEGGYVDHPNDKGGETNFGITKLVARARGYEGPMKDMPRAFAETIYMSSYIYKPNFDKVCNLDPAIGEMIIDYGVNCGTYTASKALQRALNLFNRQEHYYGDLIVDGVIGQATLQAMREYLDIRKMAGRKVLLDTIRCIRGMHYIKIAENDLTQESHIFGWIKNRI